jgi:hypothetical protein
LRLPRVDLGTDRTLRNFSLISKRVDERVKIAGRHSNWLPRTTKPEPGFAARRKEHAVRTRSAQQATMQGALSWLPYPHGTVVRLSSLRDESSVAGQLPQPN